VAAWVGAEISALTGGVATLALIAVIAAVFPAVRRFRIGDSRVQEVRAASG
jgi:hypothetical protein